jgi:hypothetical protein
MPQTPQGHVALSQPVQKALHARFTMVAKGLGLTGRAALEKALGEWVEHHAGEVGLAPAGKPARA